MIVDAHMHIWKRINGVVNGGVKVTPRGNGMITIGKALMLGMPATHLDCSARAEWVVSEFDAAGVDVGVVVQETMDGPQNDYLLSVMKDRKLGPRFFMHALPNWLNPDKLAAEGKALLRRGFKGIKCPALRVAGVTALDDRRFMPLYEAMEEAGAVLAVDLSVGAEQVGMMENIVAACPGLKIAVGHFGLVTRGKKDEWLTQIRLARHKNVYIESGGIIWLFRGEGYPFDGAVKAVRRAIREVGTDKLMWGSDWPRTMVDFTYRQSIEFVRQTKELSDAEKRKFLGENAAKLYGLKPGKAKRTPAMLVTDG